MIATTERDRVRSEVFDACAAHYCPKHAAFLAETLLDPIPNAAEEEFRRVGLADFYLAGGMSEGVILAHLADVESLHGSFGFPAIVMPRGVTKPPWLAATKLVTVGTTVEKSTLTIFSSPKRETSTASLLSGWTPHALELRVTLLINAPVFAS